MFGFQQRHMEQRNTPLATPPEDGGNWDTGNSGLRFGPAGKCNNKCENAQRWRSLLPQVIAEKASARTWGARLFQ
jgi:hypothetical protein